MSEVHRYMDHVRWNCGCSGFRSGRTDKTVYTAGCGKCQNGTFYPIKVGDVAVTRKPDVTGAKVPDGWWDAAKAFLGTHSAWVGHVPEDRESWRRWRIYATKGVVTPEKGAGTATRKEEKDMSEKKGIVDGLLDGTVDRIKDGAEIGFSGRAAGLVVNTAENILGRRIPAFTANETLNKAIRVQIAAFVLKGVSNMLGPDKACLVNRVAAGAERYVGVQLAEAGADHVEPLIDAMIARFQATTGK